MSKKALSKKERDSLENTRRRRQFLVKGIWLYFILLIFEGALRKWFLPALSTPLLIVRDPIAISLMLYAWYYNMFPTNIFIVLMTIITVFSIFTTLFFGHGNLFVAIYGARIFLVQFPFIFLMGSVLNRSDVIQFGRVVLYISIPMAVLIGFQFYSPQSAWVNRGVGGDMDGAGFGGAMGYFRPPGTFSFTSGTTAFFSMAAAFILYFWLRIGQISKVILIAATIGLIFAIPLSISRSLTFSVAVMVLFVLMTLTRKPKYLGKVFIGIIGIGILVMILNETGWLGKPMEVFLQRFDEAGKTEGGVEGTLGDRYLGGMIHAITRASERPFFGEGLGMGTNAGAALMGTLGVFLIAEEEWARNIGELGALLGISTIVIRLIITAKLAFASYFRIQFGDVLPWMLLSFTILIFPQGAWAQPTVLGFSIFIMGLLIASFNENDEPNSRNKSISTEQANIHKLENQP